LPLTGRQGGRIGQVFCDCPLDVLEQRDPKGLYAKAKSGEISNFTGVSDPYEEPEKPEITLKTGEETKEDSFEKVISYLELYKYVPPRSECILCDYSEKDERELRQNLASLGFAKRTNPD
jgi:hypothetical protein